MICKVISFSTLESISFPLATVTGTKGEHIELKLDEKDCLNAIVIFKNALRVVISSECIKNPLRLDMSAVELAVD